MDIVIRPIDEKDIRPYFDVLQSVINEKEYLLFNPGELLYEKSDEFVKDMMRRGVMVVVEADGRMIGWCDINPGERKRQRHLGRMGLGIQKGYRGQGIGPKMINEALELARKRGLKKVELDVFSTNIRAYKLYKRLGFQEEGRTKKSVKIGDKYVDLILMGKFL